MQRKRKWGVWLNNQTDRRDDEWLFVWARTPQEATALISKHDLKGFTIGHVFPIKEFRRLHPFV